MPISGLKSRRRRRPQRASRPLLLAAALLLAGCQAFPAGGSGATRPVSAAQPAAAYLAYAGEIAEAGPEQQRELYRQALQAYREHPGVEQKLRYALALSLLDAPYGSPAKAQQLLKELLTPAGQLSGETAALARLCLNAVSRQSQLETRNTGLRKNLDEAEAKIRALTTIEQTLEQPAAEPGPAK